MWDIKSPRRSRDQPLTIAVIYRVYSIGSIALSLGSSKYFRVLLDFGLWTFWSLVPSISSTFLAFLKIRASQFDATTFHLGNCSARDYVMGLFCFVFIFLLLSTESGVPNSGWLETFNAFSIRSSDTMSCCTFVGVKIVLPDSRISPLPWLLNKYGLLRTWI